jgi:hypothetical protein
MSRKNVALQQYSRPPLLDSRAVHNCHKTAFITYFMNDKLTAIRT